MTKNFSLTKRLREIGANQASLTALGENIREKTYKKGEIILQQGDYEPSAMFIVTGLVKLVYVTTSGDEFIKSFVGEGHLVGSLVSQIEGQASTFSIICLEQTKIEVVAYALLNNLVESDQAMLVYTCSLYKNLALKKEVREYEFLCLTPARRYEKFLQNYPSFSRRVTQAEIARYLGITPVALSRIKSRLGKPIEPV